MSTTTDRLEFAALLAMELPHLGQYRVAKLAEGLMSLGRSAHRLAEDMCNRDVPNAGDKQDRLYAKAIAMLNEFGARIIKPNFQYDPRGCCLKLLLPSGAYNGFGGREDGWCVPS